MNANISLSNKFITGEAYYRFFGLLTKALGVVTGFYILSSLTLYQYGVFQLLLSIFSALSVVLSLGGLVVTTDIHRLIRGGKEAHAKKLFLEYTYARLAIGLTITVAFFFGASLLGSWYESDFIEFIRILGFFFIVEAVSATLVMLVKCRLDFGAAASRPAYGKVAQLVALIGFSLTIGIATREALIASLVASVGAALAIAPRAYRAWGTWRGVPAEGHSVLLPLLRGYGKWDVVRQVFSKVIGNIQPWLIKFFISTEAVGIYSATLMLVDVAKGFMEFETLSALVPRRTADSAALRRTFILGLKVLLLAALFFTGAMLIMAPAVVISLFPAYFESLFYFSALVFILPFQVSVMHFETFLVALRAQRFLFTVSLSRNLAIPLLLVATLPFVGLWGAVITRFVTLLSLTLAELYYLRKNYPYLSFSWREIIRITEIEKAYVRGIVTDAVSLFRIKMKSLSPF